MREWPKGLFGSRPMLPITSKILLKFYTDTKKTQTPVREENLLKRKFVKNLCKKKNEFKKKRKKNVEKSRGAMRLKNHIQEK